MSHELDPQQIERANTVSKMFERFWRSAYHPDEFSREEQEKLGEFFRNEVKKFERALQVGGNFLDKNLITRVFMGLFHHKNMVLPPEDDKSYIEN